jgi:hypothetical protein
MKKTFTEIVFVRVLVISAFSLALITCSKKDEPNGSVDPVASVCGVRDPLSLPWVKDIINNNASHKLYAGARIYSYVFNGATVFYVCDPASSLLARNVYNCNGDIIIDSSAPLGAWEEFRNKRTSEALLWRKPICGVADPVNDLGWLKSLINNPTPPNIVYEGALIFSYVFRGAQVFYVSNPLSSYRPERVYDCSGNIVIDYPSPQADWTAFEKERTQQILLWSKAVCPGAGPVKDLPWLKNLINNTGTFQLQPGARIFSYIFRQNGTIIGSPWIDIWNPGAASPENVFNCSGDIIISFSAPKDKWDEFRKNRELETLLWSKE